MQICESLKKVGVHLKQHKKKYIGLGVISLIAIGLLVTTFGISQTRGAMHHMWSQIGHGYTNKGGLGIGLRVGTTAVGAGLLAGVAYANRAKVKGLFTKMTCCQDAKNDD